MSDSRQDEAHGKIWCIPRPGPLRIGFGSPKKRPILFLDVSSAQYRPIHVNNDSRSNPNNTIEEDLDIDQLERINQAGDAAVQGGQQRASVQEEQPNNTHIPQGADHPAHGGAVPQPNQNTPGAVDQPH
ncbi:unnamed protein product [Microthlaspi erraticum]|uniref:Uncharacterized protein n=1 Tax=Microthlaspi erraticum TaxID=1685480 RepID=A0A6D2JJV8_9BRAS|nr:unnamed protein product [Microthlaspi erraticum]